MFLEAKPDALPDAIDKQLPGYRRWADPALRVVAADEAAEKSRRLRASLAALPADASQLGYLRDRLLDAPFDEFPVLRDRLIPFSGDLVAGLWQVLHDRRAAAPARFRAGLALALYAADATEGVAAVESARPQTVPTAQPGSAGGSQTRPQPPGVWTDVDAAFLARELVTANPDYQRSLRVLLQPMRGRLVLPLEAIFRDESGRDTVLLAAASALAEFARDDPQVGSRS